MNRFPPNMPPRVWTLSTLIIGYALIDGFTANEQNAIGNWFMTVGQILEANASFQQVVEERFVGNTININSPQFKNGGSPYMHNRGIFTRDDDNSGSYSSSSSKKFSNNEEDVLECLEKAICRIQEELDKLKKM